MRCARLGGEHQVGLLEQRAGRRPAAEALGLVPQRASCAAIVSSDRRRVASPCVPALRELARPASRAEQLAGQQLDVRRAADVGGADEQDAQWRLARC